MTDLRYLPCLFFMLLSASAHAESAPDAVARVRKSVVVVRTERKAAATPAAPGGAGAEKPTAVGAGVVVGDGEILTTRHGVLDAASVSVELASGEKLAGEVAFVDAALDLALVRVKGGKGIKAMRPLALSTRAARQGEEAWTLGHPVSRYTWSYSRGDVAAAAREIEMPSKVVLKDVIQFTAAVAPGSSGGPLMVKGERGWDWCGVVIALDERRPGIAFAVPAKAAAEFLERCRRDSAREKKP